MAHGGYSQAHIEPGSDEYQLLRRWIAAGLPTGKDTDSKLVRISVYPPQRIMSRQAKQQLAVHAHFDDGSVVDVTRSAQYETNDTGVAGVDGSGLVRTLALNGEAGLMARHQGQVGVFRATVSAEATVSAYLFPAKTLVDVHTQRKWQQLNLAPSELCTDEEFIRRVSIDIAGTLPDAPRRPCLRCR